jgi:hypothetical protein
MENLKVERRFFLIPIFTGQRRTLTDQNMLEKIKFDGTKKGKKGRERKKGRKGRKERKGKHVKRRLKIRSVLSLRQ